LSEIIHWFKTGQRGARAEFTDSDLVTALLLIDHEPMGRYRLLLKLQLSDSSTKSLLNYGKKKEFFKITSNRLGHYLTEKGKKIIQSIKEIIVSHGIWAHQAYPEKEHYYTIISSKINNHQNRNSASIPSWKIRDISIAYGADAILLLNITTNNNLAFPEEDMNLDEYYPTIIDYYQKEIANNNYSNNLLLITAAKSVEIARKSALIASISTFPDFFLLLREEI